MRRYQEQRVDNARFSWLARQVTSYIAAGFQIEKGKPNTALEAAGVMGFDEIETAVLKATPAAPAENKEGSYERFMMGLGMTGGAKPT